MRWYAFPCTKMPEFPSLTICASCGSSPTSLSLMPLDPILKKPINRQRKKADLLHIAKELGLTLNKTHTVDDLVKAINAYLTANSDALSADPKFQLLIMHRPPTGAGGKSNTKQTGKTSADKAAEDEEEAQGLQAKPTGYVPMFMLFSLSFTFVKLVRSRNFWIRRLLPTLRLVIST